MKEVMKVQNSRKLQTIPYVSAGLVIVNIILFLLCTFSGDLLYNKGGLSPYTFFAKEEYYRAVTSMFLHGDMQHLVNNMLLLFGLGAMIEKEIGHFTFSVLYFLTGLGAGVASLWFKIYTGELEVLSVGASGAVFGLIGVLLVLVLLPGVQIPNARPTRVLFVIGYSIYCGMGQRTVDNAAHVGGVISGVVLAAVLFGVFRRGFWKKKFNQSINNIEETNINIEEIGGNYEG